MPLMPKRTKFRKSHRGSRSGNAQRGTTVAFGDFGLQTLDRGWMTNRQIEACRIAINRFLKRKGKEPIHPVRIELLRAGDQTVPMFFFSKSDAIVADDKEVAFESAFGPATIKAKFNLKDMVYEGKLAL